MTGEGPSRARARAAGRRTVRAGGGVVRIHQRLRVSTVEIGTDVSGPLCVYAVVRIERGRIEYLREDDPIAVTGRYAIVLPPFELVQARLHRCDVTVDAVAFRPAGQALPDHALLIPGSGGPLPADIDEALARVRAARHVYDVRRAAQGPALARAAKSRLDAEYSAPQRLAAIAGRLGVSPAVFSRAFSRTFGLPPVRYRHQLRVVDSLARLADGDTPIDVSGDVGFDDLSRFYKVFRRIACAPPGVYRSASTRNAKTPG